MDETIGAKGGHNDRKRVFRIQKKKKEKLRKEDEQKILLLEKELRKKQSLLLLGTIPIVVAGVTYRAIVKVARSFSVAPSKKDIPWKIKEIDDTIVTPIERKKDYKEKRKIVGTKSKSVSNDKPIILDALEEKGSVEKASFHPIVEVKNQRKEETKQFISKNQEEDKQKLENFKKTNMRFLSKENKKKEKKSTSPNISEGEINNSFPNDKVEQMINEYQKQLIEIQFELKQLLLDVCKIASEEEKKQYSEEEKDLLMQLDQLIQRLELLKKRLETGNYDFYNEYIVYQYLQEYFKFLHEESLIHRNSPFYQFLEEKVLEMDFQIQDLRSHIEDKEEEFLTREEEFLSFQKESDYFEKVEQMIHNFQLEQERLIPEITKKINHAVSVQEKTKITVEALDSRARRMLSLFTLSMLLPNSLSTKKMVWMANAYFEFARNFLHPRETVEKYQKVIVEDYHNDIEDNISSIDHVFDLIHQSSKQIEQLILDVKNQFGKTSDMSKEYSDLYYHLTEIQKKLLLREEEMTKLRQEQEGLLEENDKKVLTKGEYPL